MLIAPLLDPRDISRPLAERIRPARRILPSEAALELKNDKGDFDPSVAPMMAEPLNQLASRQYQSICFIGPQRSSKTFGLILAGLNYIVTCAPGDTLIVCPTQDAARDFSRGDLDRVIRHTPALADRLSKRAQDNNTYDKWFRNGSMVKLGWPAVSQLSSKTLRYCFLTDYDRPLNRDDVDGEGPLVDLAAKRVQTYMSRGKCLIESSIGEDLLDPSWMPVTPHEAPPVRGIASIYNNGTRGRWYWPCWHCNTFFEAKPGYGLFALPEFDALVVAVKSSDVESLVQQYAHVVCPECGGLHDQQQKPAMNAAGMWLHEGQSIVDGRRIGEPRVTNIWSGWLGGPAASYQRWDSIIRNYLQAVLTYARTGDESPMRLTTTSDAGAPYTPRAIAKERTPAAFLDRLEDWPRGTIPEGVKFLTGAVDVQGNRFVCEVWGWGEGLERWLIDRFSITASDRREGDRNAALEPAAYSEDWLVLVAGVIERRYCGMRVALTLCDSGGSEGVTQRAYEFHRYLRSKGLGNRLQLVKGVGTQNAPRMKLTMPDSPRKDRSAGGKGDVPVHLINVTIMKDAISGDLDRLTVGPGYVHFPKWITETTPEYFKELTAEIRTGKGWERKRGARNEAFDLHVYARSAVIVLGGEQINWKNPPTWVAYFATEPPKRTPQLAPQRRCWATNWRD